MANYKQENVAGGSWQRCHTLVIKNQLDKPPIFEFWEEKIIKLENDVISKDAGQLITELDNTASFDVLDLTTGLPTGQKVTQLQLKVLLTCFYFDCVKRRDGNV